MDDKPFILLTGATSAIGQAIAKALAPDRPLLLHGRDDARLQNLKNSLASPHRVETWTADLSGKSLSNIAATGSVMDGLKASLKTLLAERNIRVGGFVHCAGTLRILPFRTFREDFIREIFDVNLFSAIAILQILLGKNNLKAMNRVVFISSLSSRRGDRGNTMYAASKGALDSLVRSLAIELAPDITVNSVLPGTIETPMSRAIFDDPQARADLAAKYPAGAGRPEDVAAMVKFLLSDDAGWITAQNYRVDGGASTF